MQLPPEAENGGYADQQHGVGIKSDKPHDPIHDRTNTVRPIHQRISIPERKTTFNIDNLFARRVVILASIERQCGTCDPVSKIRAKTLPNESNGKVLCGYDSKLLSQRRRLTGPAPQEDRERAT